MAAPRGPRNRPIYSLTLNPATWDKLLALADDEGMTRSAWVERAIRRAKRKPSLRQSVAGEGDSKGHAPYGLDLAGKAEVAGPLLAPTPTDSES